MPIIGGLHNDSKNLPFSYDHFHIDGRFCSKDILDKLNARYRDGYTSHPVVPLSAFPPWQFKYVVNSIVTKSRKLRYINSGLLIPEDLSSQPKWVKWVESMKGKRCRGNKCPHYGTEMREINGKMVCPLHNLIAENGVITGIMSTIREIPI